MGPTPNMQDHDCHSPGRERHLHTRISSSRGSSTAKAPAMPTRIFRLSTGKDAVTSMDKNPNPVGRERFARPPCCMFLLVAVSLQMRTEQTVTEAAGRVA